MTLIKIAPPGLTIILTWVLDKVLNKLNLIHSILVLKSHFSSYLYNYLIVEKTYDSIQH